MESKSNSIAVGGTGYKVSLLRVAPGKEPQVADSHRAAIGAYTNSKPVCLLKLFGRYDICAIYKTNDFLDGPSRSGPIPWVRGASKTLAFHWRSRREGPGLAVEKVSWPVWALSFVRLNETLTESVGARMELLLAQVLHDSGHRDVALDVLGTTSWAEVMILLRGRRFQDVVRTLTLISQQTVDLTTNGNTHKVLLPAKTFSLFGIDFELTRRANRHKLKTSLHEAFSLTEGIHPRLTVTCPPAAMGAVQEYAKGRFSAGAVTFGAADFILQPKSKYWGDFIADVLDLRCGLKGKLFATSIGVSAIPPARGLPSLPFEVPCRHGIQMPTFLRARAGNSKWDPTLEHRLRSLYFALSNLMQDPLIGNCFEDLRILAEDQLPLLLRQLKPTDPEQKSLLDSTVEVLDHATQERAHGAFLAIEQLEGSLSPTKGGIQRILVAASSIPKRILARAHKQWYGFIVAGHYNEHFSSHYEAINLPFENLFTPEQWGGLLHEAGHAAFFDKTFYDMNGKEMDKVIAQVASGNGAFDESRWMDLAWELGPDMFELYFGYGKDLKAHLPYTLPNVLRDSRFISVEHFVRYFLLYEFWKHLLLPDRYSFPTGIHLTDDLEEFQILIKKLDDGYQSDPQFPPQAEAWFKQMAKAIEAFNRRFRQLGPPKRLDLELDDPAIKGAIASVLKGEAFLGAIPNPDTFILALRTHARKLTLSHRLAAIVSLWHSATVRPLVA